MNHTSRARTCCAPWRVWVLGLCVLLFSVGGGVARDFDGDAVLDRDDNCPVHANPDQGDIDGDRVGNVCDTENYVQLDIRPGHTENSFRPGSRKLLPVALLSTAVFDAATVDVGSVRFGRFGTETRPVRWSRMDADGDGLVDLMLEFRAIDTGLGCADVISRLTAWTENGLHIEASDTVKPSGC